MRLVTGPGFERPPGYHAVKKIWRGGIEITKFKRNKIIIPIHHQIKNYFINNAKIIVPIVTFCFLILAFSSITLSIIYNPSINK